MCNGFLMVPRMFAWLALIKVANCIVVNTIFSRNKQFKKHKPFTVYLSISQANKTTSVLIFTQKIKIIQSVTFIVSQNYSVRAKTKFCCIEPQLCVLQELGASCYRECSARTRQVQPSTLFIKGTVLREFRFL